MKNILLVLIPSFIICAGFIGAIVYESIKRPNYYGVKIIVFVGCILFLLISDIPCYKDIAENNVNTITAEYVEFQHGSILLCTRKAFFEGSAGRFHVYIPTFTRDIAKMEVGRTYEIKYFYNSHVIKEYRLIE